MDGQRENYIDSHTQTETTPLGTPPSVTFAMYLRLREMANEGHSMSHAARVIGKDRETVKKVPGIVWPKRGASLASIKHRERQQTDAWRNKRSKALRAKRLGKRYKLLDGRKLTIREIAEETGISKRTIRVRLYRGHDVLAPVNSVFSEASKGWPKKKWNVDISKSDWDIVLEYAREHGTMKAHRKFDLPIGAINAILRGDTWRVIGYPKD